jgi:drug/metabolite transporter (DMT)-like permease
VSAAAHRSTLVLCLAIVYVVWGSSYLASRIGVHDLPPLLFGGLRFAIGGVLLYLIARATSRARGRLNSDEWRHLFWVALGCVVISNACNNWALQYVASNQAALLNTSSTFMIALFGMFGPRRHALDARTAFGLAIGLGGTLLLLSPSAAVDVTTAAAPPPLALRAFEPALLSSWPTWLVALVPQLVVILGCVGWAAGTTHLRNADSSLDLLSFTGLQMALGGAMLIAIGSLAGEWSRWEWSAPALAAMAYLTVFSACIAYTAYAWLSQNATPAQVGSYGFVNPAIATLLGWAVLDEVLSTLQLLGVLIVLIALGFINVAQRATTPAAPNTLRPSAAESRPPAPPRAAAPDRTPPG